MVAKDQWVVQGWQSEKDSEGVSEAQSRWLFLCQRRVPGSSLPVGMVLGVLGTCGFDCGKYL